MKTCYTHAGNFHADDVFGAALLKIYFNSLNEEVEIKRVLDVTEAKDTDIVFDIGGGKYDHHQPNAEVRENGNKYAAFGLLWRDFGPCLVPETEAKNIDEYFIQPLDLADNFGYDNPVAEIIDSFNPNFTEETLDSNEMFDKAVAVAKQILERIIKKSMATYCAKAMVAEDLANSDGEIVELTKNVPWKDILIPSSAKFAIYLSKRGEYNAQVVPLEKGNPKAKVDFPKDWAGLRNEELEKVSGIKDLTFCHSDLFLCCAKTKEAAIKACKKALEK